MARKHRRGRRRSDASLISQEALGPRGLPRTFGQAAAERLPETNPETLAANAASAREQTVPDPRHPSVPLAMRQINPFCRTVQGCSNPLVAPPSAANGVTPGLCRSVHVKQKKTAFLLISFGGSPSLPPDCLQFPRSWATACRKHPLKWELRTGAAPIPKTSIREHSRNAQSLLH